jgi:hypothetical protein
MSGAQDREVTPGAYRKVIRILAHDSAYRIPIRFCGIGPQAARASEMPAGRLRKSNISWKSSSTDDR